MSPEIINPDYPRGDFRAAIFDFDGTLSLLRRNWQDVMVPMMVEILAETGTTESRDELHALVEDFVTRLTGRQTIYQMIRLAEEVTRRGGQALEPLEYKRRYHDLLWQQVGDRVEAARSGRVSRDHFTVPGSRQLLEKLAEAGIQLYLASGTDLPYVLDEAEVLGLDHFFGPRIYGALDDYKRFSKAMIIEKIIEDIGTEAEQAPGIHVPKRGQAPSISAPRMGQALDIHAPEPVPFVSPKRGQAPSVHASEPVPFSEPVSLSSPKMGQAPDIHAPEPAPFSEGRNIVGFGDGFVEIEEIKKVGGLAVGVASEEETCSGVNAWKRQRLIEAGADLIIGDYRDLDDLLRALVIGK